MRMMLLILVHHANLENLVRNAHSLPVRSLMPSYLQTGMVNKHAPQRRYEKNLSLLFLRKLARQSLVRVL